MRRRASYAQKTDEFLALCRAGTPRDLIAARLGLTVKQINNLHQWLERIGRCPRRLGYAARPRKRQISILEGRQAEIGDLLRTGHSLRGIARQIGSTPGAVAGFVDRRNLKPKRPKRLDRADAAVAESISLPALPPVPDGAIDIADLRAGAWMQRAMEDVA
jgi:DNA-binding CsgD family transcriptional regulator